MNYDPSGRTLAEEAHAAGVVEPQENEPTSRVDISFTILRADAKKVADALSLEIFARSDVLALEYSVTDDDE